MRQKSLLDPTKIIETIGMLEKRITDRFPNSGLRKVIIELHAFSLETQANNIFISKPNILLRFSTYLLILIGLVGIVFSFSFFRMDLKVFSLKELLILSESIFNNLILIGGALFFLITMEARIKRKRALRALHGLRVICHVIDMHQLNKDPYIFSNNEATAHSPKREYTKFELQRYLDYCSESSALVAKVAALYAQSIQDEIIISSVNEIEILTTGLSRKVWQKIRVLQNMKDGIPKSSEASKNQE